ncbi:MAG: glycoside hydrolase family 127 protein [Candidatus Didemnitutus sp.]|nr:glycoside hydrolase family 127 protein [Candidatus Didemnitutus sp.]
MSQPTVTNLSRVRFAAGFLAERARLVREVVIPYQWEALNDRVPGAERSGTVHNFQVAAGEKPGKFHGLWFQDSDLAKWIEAACYRLATHPDAALEGELDTLIATIAKAQLPDGYLDTYIQLVEPNKRWANLHEFHELYIAGHFIEAGVAHFEATGKRSLLDVVVKLANLIERTFGLGPEQIAGYCGHEEIELALIKLSRAIGEQRYLQLAAYFVNQRGAEPNYYEAEIARLGIKKLPPYFYRDRWAYLQAHQPVREQTEPIGHAVRAMYLYSAMADLARELDDDGLRQTCRTLWREIHARHLYVTGGIGAEWMGEKFAEPYDLPNDRAYAETCASIGLVFFARRMLELELDGSYGDVMERALHNNVLAGMALDGKTFFYVNPLQVRPAEARRRYDHTHVKTQRVPWFGCACCPPNIARTLASLAGYTHSVQPDGLALHLYAACQMNLTVARAPVKLSLETDYPWDGTVVARVNPDRPVSFALRLRVPGWCTTPEANLNGEPVDLAAKTRSGYLALEREWRAGDVVTLRFPMVVERVRAHSRVHHSAGCVALQRGPMVYCLEQVDNGAHLDQILLPQNAVLQASFEPGSFGGAVVITTTARRIASAPTALYTTTLPASEPAPLRAIPYALWANRGEGEMNIWIREC